MVQKQFCQFARKSGNKKTKKFINLSNQTIQYNIFQALNLVKAHATAPYDETVDIILKLNVNPKHGDQNVRGTCQMPAGLGKTKKVAVLSEKENESKVLEYGADIVGNELIFQNISEGKIEFDVLFATQEQMAQLKNYAKILGPLGLMPNQRTGTLILANELEKKIKDAKMGQVTYRVDVGSNISAPIGKISFDDEKLFQNLNSLTKSLIERKPISVKGQYFKQFYIKSSFGDKYKVDVKNIDPKSKNYLLFQF